MSDDSDKVEFIDLRPFGQRPEGYTYTEIQIDRDDLVEAVTLISGISATMAASHGENKAVKDLMLGIEASAVALCQFTTAAQVVNILGQAIKRIREFEGFLEKAKAADEAAAGGVMVHTDMCRIRMRHCRQCTCLDGTRH